MTLSARSLLFVPGDRERFYEKAGELDVDAVIVDLEDGVTADARPAARALARARLRTLGRPAWIRINAIGSDDLAADLEAIAGADGLAGLVVPKVAGPADILALEAALDSVLGGAPTPLIAMIESARGVVNALAIAEASPRVVSLCFGGARGGDLHRDLGSDWSIDGPELLHERQQVLLAARAAGLAWPLDGVFSDVRDPDGFRRDTELSRRLGFRGRPVIHPSQAPLANAAYAPTSAEVNAARRVIAAVAAATAAGQGTATVDGQMVDQAMARHAEAILAHADAITGNR
jgi:citrate lyase subunit beta/citryl-CoA lyase